MILDDLVQRPGEWLRGDGRESDIVISTRVRLARNVKRFFFVPMLSEERRRDAAEYLTAAIQSAALPGELAVLDLETLSDLDRQILVERHLISREHADAEGGRSVAVDRNEVIAIMINEEDHLRIQALRSGLALQEAYGRVDAVDDALGAVLDYAWSERYGYLTACPTNVGTGMRVSVMLHLPVLSLTRHIQKVYNAVSRISLTVRGFYGEGTEAAGDLYQVSNQVTLGKSETDILREVDAVVTRIVDYERRARTKLFKQDAVIFKDRVGRAYHALIGARIISSEETLRHLSAVRTGIHLGLLDKDKVSLPGVNELFVQMLPGHLQKIAGETLDPKQRDIFRSTLIRKKLAGDN